MCKKTILKALALTLLICIHGFSSGAQQNAADSTAADTAALIPLEPAGPWDFGGSVGINFSQVSLTNWAGGGQSSLSIGSIVNLTADYSRGKSVWENRLDVAYGMIRQGDSEGSDFKKTDDLLNILSKYNYHLRENFFITALTDFRTQIDVGYEYKTVNGEVQRNRISEFMAPGFLVSSLGATYKKGKKFTLTLSPFTSKFTFVLDDKLSNAGAFGVSKGERVRSELGAAFRTIYHRDIFESVNFRSSLNLFANYKTFSHVDVNWEGTLAMKVNKYINSTVSAQLVYDHDVIQKVQWRNAILVGFQLLLD